MKKILLINSLEENILGIKNLLDALKEGDNSFLFFSSTNIFDKQFKDYKVAKISLGCKLKGFFSVLFFLPLLPFFWLKYFLKLSFLKKKEKISTAILINDNEKLIFSPILGLLKLKNVWLESPHVKYADKSGFLILLLKLFSKKAQILTFTNSKREELLKLKFKEERVKNISLGVKLDVFERQDDIFSNLAMMENKPTQIKHFTVGIVTDLNFRKEMESLIRALSICAESIPNLQVIIIGEGKERKKLGWLAKNTGLAKIAWFVGEQEQLKKWINGFDLYISINENPDLFDLNIVLEAMLCGLPVMSFSKEALSDVVIPDRNGFFVDSRDHELLAQKIIALEQDYIFRSNIGKEAEKNIRENFNQDKQLDIIKKVL